MVAVLAADSLGRQIISVHVKRAYRLSADGVCRRADEPEPLLFMREPDGENDYGVPESDVIPFKSSTDLIVMARAHAARGSTSSLVGLRIGALERRYRVWGPRRCSYSGPGTLRFGSPEPFESVPISYEFAYGGIDPTVPVPESVPLGEVFNRPPGAYPRNTIGRGYAVFANKERLDGMVLPQIENPADLLTPERTVAGHPHRWWRQPFPWSLDWFDALWYPRHRHFGTLPDGLPDDDHELFEVKSGWVEPQQRRRWQSTPADQRLDARFADAASPALVLPTMNGNESVLLTGIMPGGAPLEVRLPADVPRIMVRIGDKSEQAHVVLNRVLISTLQMGVYLVWHGIVHPARELPSREASSPEQQVRDLEGVEVTADGEKVPSYAEWEAGVEVSS
jgi:hypothetical protein